MKTLFALNFIRTTIYLLEKCFCKVILAGQLKEKLHSKIISPDLIMRFFDSEPTVTFSCRCWIYGKNCHERSLKLPTAWPLWPKFNERTALCRNSKYLPNNWHGNRTSNREMVHSPGFCNQFSMFGFWSLNTAHFDCKPVPMEYERPPPPPKKSALPRTTNNTIAAKSWKGKPFCSH